jgi:hypothetical protein
MVMAHKERVGRGLDAVRDGIGPVCTLVWTAQYGDDWITTIQARDRGAVGKPDPSDVSFLLKGMHNTWQEAWRDRLGPAERAYTSELRDFRNSWAHGGKFTTDDTYRMLDTAERLLGAFSAAEQVKIVQELKRDLQRQNFDEQARSERRKTAAKPTDGEPLQGLAPWREVMTPHADVASGDFEQAEFAADLYQVATGNADPEYGEPVAFFSRTYLTNGLRDLLIGAAKRLSGSGGDPVIDLQTNFGGGKTHSMIAMYHLASGTSADELRGVGELLREEGLSVPKQVARAVIVGQWVSPASPSVKPDGTEIYTLWGEIAYQLAGRKGYELVEAEDVSGSNPASKLIELFRMAGPSIVLIDEWVAYARQLPSKDTDPALTGGQFDTQFTFAQALTEAAAAVDNVVVLVSIPASDLEIGGDKGREALQRLSHVVRRTSAQWKPAEDDESFEIVRRRLFEPITEENARVRDGIIKAFVDSYRAKPGDFPSHVSEAEYRRRMELSYPIHPELFDRLYSDWSTLDRFQRTRGVLRLMAKVISVLWDRGDQNLMIMPGTLPLDESQVSNELTGYLSPEWDPVIRSDIDGGNALPLHIDQANRNLGRYSATRRVARAVFMASAPQDDARNGIDIKVITLGVAQPGEAPGTFADALRRLSGDATYLYVDGSQYWYSLRPNITRLAADRANSNVTDNDADDEIKRRLQKSSAGGPFAGVHAFPDGPGDVPDDNDGVHLVVLPTTSHHVPSTDDSPALAFATQLLTQRNAGPRLNRNLLVFCAASETRLAELRTAVRQYLAWQSILDDHKSDRIELSKGDESQAKSKLSETDETITQRVFETYQHVLVPEQAPGTREIRWHQTKPSGAGSLAERVARKLESEERLITNYGGTRVRMDLDKIPLWTERKDISVEALWKAYSQFPYLPRLASSSVLLGAVSDGVSKLDWETETFAYADGHDDSRWVGMTVAQHVAARPSGLLVAPDAAAAQIAADAAAAAARAGSTPDADVEPGSGETGADSSTAGDDKVEAPPTASTERSYYAQFSLDSVRAIRQLEDILQNVVQHLASAPGSSVELTMEINASSDGFEDRVRRVVKENANQLGAKGNQGGEFE